MNAAPTGNDPVISIAEKDARVLSLIGHRLVEWDHTVPARIVAGEQAIACYSILPMDVMAVVATPAEVSASAVGRDPVVSLHTFISGIDQGLESGDDISFNMDGLPEVAAPIQPGLSLQQLPPKEGWQMPIHGVASDVMPQVHEAVQEFQVRTQGASANTAAAVAEEIWSRPAWAGLPTRVLHAARRLRMITDEPLRITASTCGPWKRLSTPRGQLFVYTPGIEARLGLHVVR